MRSSRLLTPVTVMLLLAVAATAAWADPRLGIYDSDAECPGGCDAHVVFHPTLNGTAFAHKPGGNAGVYEKCDVDQDCRLCFDGAESCLTVKYRGEGPRPRAFDFTPAFYAEQCPRPDLPRAVADECRMLARATKQLDGKVNCIRTPEQPACVAIMRDAATAQQRASKDAVQCRPGTYAGKSGKGCCTGNVYGDAALGAGCVDFYPAP